MIKFHCARCGQKIGVPDEHGGKRINCPNCGAAVPIPRGEGPLDELAAAARGAEAEPHFPTAPVEPPAPSAAPRPTAPLPGLALPFPARQLDAALNVLRGQLGSQVFKTVAKAAYLGTVYGMLVLAALLVAGAIVGGLSRQLDYSPTKDYLILAGLLIVAQYLVSKIYRAGLSLVSSSPSAIASGSVPDCLALVGLAVAAGAIAVGVYRAVVVGEAIAGALFVVLGLAVSPAAFAVSCACLNPRTLNVSVRGGLSAGQEAIGLLSFFLKLSLAVGPIILFCLVLTAVFTAGAELTLILLKRSTILVFWWTERASTAAIVFSGVYVGVYVVFLVYHLIVDLVQSVFEIARNTRGKQ